MKSIKKIVVTIFVLGLAACAPQGQPGSKANEADLSAGIIGGLEVPANYPLANHVVALYSPTQKFLCTGTLMENNFVLTAAHCIPQDGKLAVMFTVNIRAPNVYMLPSDAAVFHPNWNPKGLGQENLGDIAVVHYKGQTPANYKPLPLMTVQQQRFMKPGILVMAAGYGLNKSSDQEGGERSGSGVLRRGSMRITKFDGLKTEVALDLSQGTGICSGDSGGPAIVFIGGQAYVWGVSSYVNSKACDKFGVLTNAPAYTDWLNQTKATILKRLQSQPQ